MHEALATGVIVAYYRRRIPNLPKIANAMLRCPHIDRVIVWNNGGDNILSDINKEFSQLDGDMQENIYILNSNRNVSLFGRYLACQSEFVDNSLIATCDDDVLVPITTWDVLYRNVVTTGRLCCCLDTSHYRLHERGTYCHKHQYGTAWETLLGYGSIFPVRFVEVLNRYIDDRGVDTLLERKADRLFTILQNREHVVFQTKVIHMTGARDHESYFRQRDHVPLNRKAYQVAVELLNKWGEHGLEDNE